MADDDPVIASYDVYITEPLSSDIDDPFSKLFLLQYPSHRPSSKPYNAARSQAPHSLRRKPQQGFLEIDVPILTHEHYSEVAGKRFGKAVADSRTMHAGGTHGLAGGFATGSGHPRLKDIPMHEQPNVDAPSLTTQTLGGKIVKPSPRDPIYLVGCFQQNKLHLSHLDAVVQLRPQLHHVDAEDELNQKRFQSANNAASSRQKSGLESATPKVESKAIEIKIKDSKEDAKDRSQKDNATLLREIQIEEWQHHEWIDEDEPEAKHAFDTHMRLPSESVHPPPRLQSAISNGDWLDKMSAPREDGKKGLLAKLRGRERERARRKKAEEEKRQRQKETTVAGTSAHGQLLDMSSDSDLSSPEASDSDTAGDLTASGDIATDQIQIKEEPGPPAPMSSGLPPTASTSASATAPKKRGRPRKIKPTEAIPIED